jgi:hypothetical protein
MHRTFFKSLQRQACNDMHGKPLTALSLCVRHVHYSFWLCCVKRRAETSLIDFYSYCYKGINWLSEDRNAYHGRMVIPRRLQHKECSSRTGNRRLNVDLDWSGSGNRTRPRPCPQLMPRSAMSFPHSMPSEPNAISHQTRNRQVNDLRRRWWLLRR